MQIWTGNLTSGNSITITADLNIMQLSVAASGTSAGTITGNLFFAAPFGASTATTLNGGESFSLIAQQSNTPISGIVIACTSGSLSVVLAVSF